MAGLKDISNVWRNVREVDLRPIRDQALRDLRIALVGKKGSGRHALAEHMRQDPARPGTRTHTPMLILDLANNQEANDAHLIILLVDAASKDFSRQQALVSKWSGAGKKVIVFYNIMDETRQSPNMDVVWDAYNLLVGPADKPDYLLKHFVPAVMAALPDEHLALGRYFPLFRVPVAHELINETTFSNAGYALTSGLAELVPMLGLPLTLSDMIILTKAQAFLVYRLGLELGYSTRWQDYLSEFGGVIGSGFLWRNLARYLIGLVPLWGIIPKVAVAYSGTYVVGHAVLRWYLTGKHISPAQIRQLYRQAFEQGKAVARGLLARRSRPRLGRRKPAELQAPLSVQTCPECGKVSAADARFCQYCGHDFQAPAVQ